MCGCLLQHMDTPCCFWVMKNAPNSHCVYEHLHAWTAKMYNEIHAQIHNVTDVTDRTAHARTYACVSCLHVVVFKWFCSCYWVVLTAATCMSGFVWYKRALKGSPTSWSHLWVKPNNLNRTIENSGSIYRAINRSGQTWSIIILWLQYVHIWAFPDMGLILMISGISI